jgi:hypothetical protein
MKTAKLRIETREPHNGEMIRIRPQDVRLFLNDVELQTWCEFSLTAGKKNGCMKLSVDLFIDELRIDADALIALNDLTQQPETDS